MKKYKHEWRNPPDAELKDTLAATYKVEGEHEK
jgi:hypothetical protein